MIIGIDGPAGSGKTTVAKLLAKRLGIFYLDTGAMYRALTLKAIGKKVDLSDSIALKEIAVGLNLKFKEDKIYLDDSDVSDQIRTPLVEKSISQVVALPEVRSIMVGLQRDIVVKGDFVVEGRDITTVVFPDAKYKFYIDATPAIRSKRRFKELADKGIKIDFQELDKDLKKRDNADKTRKFSPLKVSKDAVFIDTSNLTISGTADEIIKHMNSKDK
ncbi:MAG: (d)CMP kinase [Candidatus Susulua stagnicola]|nr:(d)CMP kinase [Candidatus Susulua stagnicola]